MPAGLADGVDNDVVGGLSCTAGQVPKKSLMGPWACAADDNATYSVGTGLALGGTVFSVSSSYRLPQACANGQVAKWNGAAWACAADDNTTYTAGAGLTLAGTQFSALFAGSGAADTVSRSDHAHDTTYWKLTGNTSTTPGTNFLGTTDNQALEVKV